MAHAFSKISRGSDVFAASLQALGVPAPHLTSWITITIELVGGLAIILGAFIPYVSILLSAIMLVAIFKVHLAYGFSSIKLVAVTANGAQFGPPGYEVGVLYLACLAALVLGGPGPIAFDTIRHTWYLSVVIESTTTESQNSSWPFSWLCLY
jgi:putative oxidoreductase